MTTVPTKPKNREIEALRGLAVSLAILTHLPVLLPFHGPALFVAYNTVLNPGMGVDLFFCISGFVVSKAFLDLFDRHIATGTLPRAFQAFWIRRAFRLLPTSWLWVLVALFLSVAFNSTGVFSTPVQNLRSAALVVTMTGNLVNQFGMSLTPNDHYWSLALEEQFYLLFPLFLFIVPANRRWTALLALIGVQFFIDRNVNVFSSRAALIASGIRVDSIMWGVLIFLFSRTPHYLRFEPAVLGASRVALAAVNVLLVYLLVTMLIWFPVLPAAMGLVAMVVAALVFLASYERGYTTPVPSLARALEWIGVRSYAIYIIHMFAYRLTFEGWSRYAVSRGTPLTPADTLPMVATAVVVLLVLVEANFRLVEIPLRDRGKRIAEARLDPATRAR